jgi:hypothetical protein
MPCSLHGYASNHPIAVEILCQVFLPAEGKEFCSVLLGRIAVRLPLWLLKEPLCTGLWHPNKFSAVMFTPSPIALFYPHGKMIVPIRRATHCEWWSDPCRCRSPPSGRSGKRKWCSYASRLVTWLTHRHLLHGVLAPHLYILWNSPFHFMHTSKMPAFWQAHLTYFIVKTQYPSCLELVTVGGLTGWHF